MPHFQQYIAQGDKQSKWSSRPHRELAELAQRKSVAFLNAHTALARRINGTEHHRYYYRGDMHLNPRGNALWAKTHIALFTDPALRLLPDAFFSARSGGRER